MLISLEHDIDTRKTNDGTLEHEVKSWQICTDLGTLVQLRHVNAPSTPSPSVTENSTIFSAVTVSIGHQHKC